jgi:trigger factor
MEITITPKKAEGVERLLQVSVPVDAIRAAEDKTARRYASNVRLPGFRQGKAPAAMVRKQFAEQIRQETLESLVREAFETVIEREKLQPISQPHVHDLSFKDGEPLTFELHVEVKPEITLSRVEGFRVKRPVKSVSDEDVTTQVDALRDQRATWTPVEDRPLPGDMVTVELATADADGTMPAGKEYRLVLGTGQAIAGIEELVMEATTGKSVERMVKWPDDFPDEAQRGKTKLARALLKDVKRKSVPPLDDAFAREAGDFEDLAALRKTVREDLQRHADQDAEAELRGQLLEQILSANAFDVPPSWVSSLVDNYAEAYQVPEAERAKFRTEFRPVAEGQVRRDLVVETLAQRESLTATEQDVDDKIGEMAKTRGADPGKLYATLQKAGRIRELERSITEDRVFGWLLSKNLVE